MQFIQCIYAIILNSSYKLISKISAKQREKIIQLLLIFYAIWIILVRSQEAIKISIRGEKTPIVCGIIVFLISVFSVTKPLRRIKWRKSICFFYYTTGLLMLLSMILHTGATATDKIYVFEWLFLFPMLYYVWGNRKDYVNLFEKIAKAFCYVGFAYLIFLICFFPKEIYQTGGGLYIASTTNPNVLALVISSSVIAGVYVFIACGQKVVPIITICLGTGVVISCQSRTALFAIVMSLVVAMILTFYSLIRDKNSFYAKKILLLAICVGLMFLLAPFSNYLFDIGRPVLAKASSILDKFSKGDTLNAITSGRIDIWIHCLQESHLLGSSNTGNIHLGGRTYYGAHNSIIEMIYRYGFLAGLSYIGLWISAVIVSIKTYIKTSYKEGLFAIMMIASFFVMAMFELVFTPFNTGLAFINIFAFCILFGYPKKDKEGVKYGNFNNNTGI